MYSVFIYSDIHSIRSLVKISFPYCITQYYLIDTPLQNYVYILELQKGIVKNFGCSIFNKSQILTFRYNLNPENLNKVSVNSIRFVAYTSVNISGLSKHKIFKFFFKHFYIQDKTLLNLSQDAKRNKKGSFPQFRIFNVLFSDR